MPGTPLPGRGVVANARKDDVAFHAVSWHAPNAVPNRKRAQTKAEAIARKMVGYQALIDAVNSIDGPLIAGMDTNHWSLNIDLELGAFDSKSRHAIENQFFSSDPQHRLRDALLDHLRSHPAEYEEVKRIRPEGPLAVTHRRGKTDDRFDYINVSDEFIVDRVFHYWEDAAAGISGSDHGLVQAEVRLRRAKAARTS